MKARDIAITVTELDDTGDERGRRFAIPDNWRRILRDSIHMHVLTICPGCVRGNHYHPHSYEVMMVFYEDIWSLHWDSGPGTERQSRSFEGRGGVMVELNPMTAHAIKNSGKRDLHVVAAQDTEQEQIETVRQVLVS